MTFTTIHATYRKTLAELIRRIRGEGTTGGLRFTNEIQATIEKSIKEKESYIALKECEFYMYQVEQTKFDLAILRAAMHHTLEDPNLSRSSAVSDLYKKIKALDKEAALYTEILKEKTFYMKDLLAGLTSVNTSMRMIYGENINKFNYDS